MNYSDVNNEQTEAFIKQNPSDVTLLRRTRTADGAGGWVLSQLADSATQEYGPYTARKVASSRLSATKTSVTSDGRIVVPEFAVVFLADTDVVEFDIMLINEKPYEVITVSRNPEWRVTGEVVSFNA